MTKVEFTIPIHSVKDTIKQEAETKAKEAYVMTLPSPFTNPTIS